MFLNIKNEGIRVGSLPMWGPFPQDVDAVLVKELRWCEELVLIGVPQTRTSLSLMQAAASQGKQVSHLSSTDELDTGVLYAPPNLLVLVEADTLSILTLLKGLGLHSNKIEKSALSLANRAIATSLDPLVVMIERAMHYYVPDPYQTYRGFLSKFGTVVADIARVTDPQRDPASRRTIYQKYKSAERYGNEFINTIDRYLIEKNDTCEVYDFARYHNQIPFRGLGKRLHRRTYRIYLTQRYAVVDYSDQGSDLRALASGYLIDQHSLHRAVIKREDAASLIERLKSRVEIA